MANLNITNLDIGSVIVEGAKFRDDIITFAGAATYSAGTILARSTASGKLIAYVKGGGVDGNGVPVAILTYDVTATGAGDISSRAGVSGVYRKEKLIILADGDASNVDNVVMDLLRDYSLIPLDVNEINILDNQ